MIKEVEKYKAIGEEIRLRILRVLVKAQQELCVCEIVDVLEKPQYNISKNLSILRKAELVEEQRAGKLMMYKVINDNLINKKIFESISVITCDNNPVFKNDFSNLKKRLSIRKNGKCVVTYKK